jgi:hypothetical protein
VCGCLLVYAAIFGTGSRLYGRMPQFYAWLALFVASGVGMWRVSWTEATSPARRRRVQPGRRAPSAASDYIVVLW